MIQKQTILKVADNTGAKSAMCIGIFGGYRKRFAKVGDVITIAVKQAAPHLSVKKGDVLQAVVVRTKKEIKRKDGSYVRFDDNAGVAIDKMGLPRGTRILGPVAREVKEAGYNKIASLAREVI